MSGKLRAHHDVEDWLNRHASITTARQPSERAKQTAHALFIRFYGYDPQPEGSVIVPGLEALVDNHVDSVAWMGRVAEYLDLGFPGYGALLKFVTRYQAIYPACACHAPHYVDGKRVKCTPCDAKSALAAAGVEVA